MHRLGCKIQASLDQFSDFLVFFCSPFGAAFTCNVFLHTVLVGKHGGDEDATLRAGARGEWAEVANPDFKSEEDGLFPLERHLLSLDLHLTLLSRTLALGFFQHHNGGASVL